jgi:hypothetical protein
MSDLQLLKTILERLEEARKRHPVFAQGHEKAVRVIKSEMLEWEAQAILVESSIHAERISKADNEALDVITVLMRYLHKEYK